MTQYINILKQADIFYGLTPTQLELLDSICREQIFAAGDIIFPEGANSDELYVIVQGVVDILINLSLVSDQPDKHEAAVIATLRRGQSFGEIALVDRGLRSATARASQHTRLMILPRDKLIMLCEAYPQLGYRLMQNLAADLSLKLRNTDLRIREELLYRPKDKS
jgi:CRP-like cAMP-binding protein